MRSTYRGLGFFLRVADGDYDTGIKMSNKRFGKVKEFQYSEIVIDKENSVRINIRNRLLAGYI